MALDKDILTRQITTIFLVGSVLWIVSVTLWVPSLIESMYLGNAPSFLSSVIEGQETNSLEYYQRIALGNGFAAIVFFAFLWGFAVVVLDQHPFSWQKFIGTASASELAWIRIITASAMLVYTVLEDSASVALFPSGLLYPKEGFINELYGVPLSIESLTESASALSVLKLVTITSLILVIIGFRTKWSLVAAVLCCALLGGIHRQYSHFFHHGLIPLYLLTVLMVFPCGDALSLDSKLKPGDSSKKMAYSYGRFACWTVYTLVYFFVGMSKIREGGFYWFHGSTVQNYATIDSLNLIEFDINLVQKLAQAPLFIFSLVGLLGLYSEISALFIIFSRRARVIIPLLLIGLHFGIFLLHEVNFFDAMILPLIFLCPRSFKAGGSSPSKDHVQNQKPYQFFILGIIGIALISWVGRVEHYPFSAWQMYSGSAYFSKEIDYYKINAETSNGMTFRTDLSDIFSMLSRGRFMDHLQIFPLGKKKEESEKLDKLFEIYAKEYKKNNPESVSIDSFRVENWRWKLREEPVDESQLVETYTYRVKQ